MPTPLVECIPNFSDARRPEVIQAIIEAISSVPQVVVLDHHSDTDHNRTVVTYIGPPAAVEEAAYRAIAAAARLINLDEHRGAHPRLGATDVVPFVPISGVTMEECVAMAQRLGDRVGHTLNIPVYLYEEAAARPERVNLENIRRGQYEALKEEMGVKPERDPDFGPHAVGSAGATVIGARHPLVAFNVYLTTGEVTVAKQIAKVVRHSSGGLRYVKGLGLLVDGLAQVSMNLTNFRATSLATVMALIRSEAARHGVSVHHSELVGLIPQEALIDAAVWSLQLDQFEPEQVLEGRMQAALAAADEEPAPPSFLDALASGEPAPGGGSAAAYAAAVGAALAAMVARLTIGRKKYAEAGPLMERALARAEELRAEMDAAVVVDAAAFESVMEAFRLPKETPEQAAQRNLMIEAATLQAAQSPLNVAKAAVAVMELGLQVASVGNLNAITDGATGAAMARAALTGAGYNLRINLKTLTARDVAESMLAAMSALEDRADQIDQALRQTLRERADI